MLTTRHLHGVVDKSAYEHNFSLAESENKTQCRAITGVGLCKGHEGTVDTPTVENGVGELRLHSPGE